MVSEAVEIDKKEFRTILVHKVLPALRRKGFVIRSNFQCCVDHAKAYSKTFVDAQEKEGAVFWSRKEDKQIDEEGTVPIHFFAAKDTPETHRSVGQTIVLTLKENNLFPEWNGDWQSPVIAWNRPAPKELPQPKDLAEAAKVIAAIQEQMSQLNHTESETLKKIEESRRQLAEQLEKAQAQITAAQKSHKEKATA